MREFQEKNIRKPPASFPKLCMVNVDSLSDLQQSVRKQPILHFQRRIFSSTCSFGKTGFERHTRRTNSPMQYYMIFNLTLSTRFFRWARLAAPLGIAFLMVSSTIFVKAQ